MSLSVAIVVPAPVEVVWQQLSDLKRWPEWNPTCVSAECDTPNVVVGSRLRLHLRHPKGRLFWTMPTIGELTPPTRMVLVTRALGFRAPVVFDLSPHEDGGTQVLLTSQSTGPLAFTYRLMFPEKSQGLLWSGALTGLVRSALPPTD